MTTSAKESSHNLQGFPEQLLGALSQLTFRPSLILLRKEKKELLNFLQELGCGTSLQATREMMAF